LFRVFLFDRFGEATSLVQVRLAVSHQIKSAFVA
jgi:hypothetical protein